MLQYLELAQQSAGMGYVSLDPAAMQLTLSRWVCELVGADPVIAVADVPNFVAPEDRDAMMAQIEHLIAERAPFRFESRLRKVDGTSVRVRIAGNAVYREEGHALAGFYAIVQDIEDFRSAEEAARRAAQNARGESEARERMVATLSHEIRTPLTGIVAIIDQLRREPRSEERQRALTLIEESAEALLATLDGILRHVRAAEGGGSEDAIPFNPQHVVQRVTELFRPLARRKGVALDAAKPTSGADALVLGAPTQLQQVLSNLVSNAIKFTASGHVSLRCSVVPGAAGTWDFEVVDTGLGIEPARLRTIFSAFGGSAGDSLGRDSGAGLGLSITKAIVDRMGGTIAVDSKPGQGTHVHLRIPFAPASERKPTRIAQARLAVRCASASRELTIMALADEAGIEAHGWDENAHDASTIVVIDESFAGLLAPDAIATARAVIVIAEDEGGGPMAAGDAFRVVPAVRLSRALPDLLKAIVS